MIKHYQSKKTWGEKYLCNLIVIYVDEGKIEQELNAETEAKSMEEFCLFAFSVCFLILPKTAHPRVAPPIVAWSLLN